MKRGQPIGVVGWTGMAGHRHLHWSLQKLPGASAADWEARIPNWSGDSVPFVFRTLFQGREQLVDVAALRCPHAVIGGVPRDQQPRFRGVR